MTETITANTVIELTDEQWADITKSSRVVQPSPYQDAVNAAVLGKNYAVPITTETTSRTIVNNLHKAERVAKKSLQVVVRDKATPPLVAWRVVVKADKADGTDSTTADNTSAGAEPTA